MNKAAQGALGASPTRPTLGQKSFLSESNSWKQILLLWLPATLWLGVIAVESTNALSSQHTGAILRMVLSFFFGQIETHRFNLIHGLLRKAGHFFGYAILSWLFFRAWRGTLAVSLASQVTRTLPASILKNVWRARWAALAIVLTIIVAALDEWHQTHLTSRTGKVADVVLDTFGGIFAQTVILVNAHSPGKLKALTTVVQSSVKRWSAPARRAKEDAPG